MSARLRPVPEVDAAEGMTPDSRQSQIYEAAARVFCEKGFGQSSMQDIAEAVDMTKAGVYHHIASKNDLLFGIMSYAMDLAEERVLDRVRQIRDPEERLRASIRGHVLLITRDRPKEVTVVLNEGKALQGELGERIDRRKLRYVRFLQGTIQELIDSGRAVDMDPRIATFSLIGMMNWIYQWYRPAGRIDDTELAEAMADFFLRGLLREPGTD